MENTVVIIDDDIAYSNALSQAFTKRNYAVSIAHDFSSLEKISDLSDISYGVVDLRIGEESGLLAIKLLLKKNPAMKIVMLTVFLQICKFFDNRLFFK